MVSLTLTVSDVNLTIPNTFVNISEMPTVSLDVFTKPSRGTAVSVIPTLSATDLNTSVIILVAVVSVIPTLSNGVVLETGMLVWNTKFWNTPIWNMFCSEPNIDFRYPLVWNMFELNILWNTLPTVSGLNAVWNILLWNTLDWNTLGI